MRSGKTVCKVMNMSCGFETKGRVFRGKRLFPGQRASQLLLVSLFCVILLVFRVFGWMGRISCSCGVFFACVPFGVSRGSRGWCRVSGCLAPLEGQREVASMSPAFGNLVLQRESVCLGFTRSGFVKDIAMCVICLPRPLSAFLSRALLYSDATDGLCGVASGPCVLSFAFTIIPNNV